MNRHERSPLARFLLGLLVLAALLALLIALQRFLEPHERVELDPNGRWKGEIDFSGAGRLDFELPLPEDAVLARVELRCTGAELDFYGRAGVAIGDTADAPYALTDPGEPREFVLDCLGSEPLAGTTWYFSAQWPYGEPPRSGGKRLERARVTVLTTTFDARVDGELSPGEPLRSQLDEASGGFRTFRVEVPADARTLRVDLFELSSDLDLYARAGGQILARGPGVALAENDWGHETLVIDADSKPPLAPGAWYVDVFDAVGPTRTLPFSILASLDAGVPARLRALPEIPAAHDETPLAHALRAVVELATDDGEGSGTILTPDGWILTNEHVVGDDPEAEIVVSLPLDPTLPPEEALRAVVVRADVERDLALVRVVSGLYGQELPRGYALPTLEFGDPAALTIGDPLWLVGYPTTGGTGSRVTISATRGIVAGFERYDFGVRLKTDAEITNGNSGGAALDARGLLVGVPSSTVENGSGQIGYVEPITALPREWLELIGR